MLDEFLGYDHILMSSIKELAEKEENKGKSACTVPPCEHALASSQVLTHLTLQALLVSLKTLVNVLVFKP